jgi:hypothetical protein
MPSISRAQQAVMGQAWGLRKGLLKLKDIDSKYRKEIKGIANGDMTDKELKKFASTKSKPLPHYAEAGKPYAEKPANESDSFGPDLLDDATQHYNVGDKFLVINTSKFPDWYGGFRGYENLKVGDAISITKIAKNANGFVYFNDKDPEFGLGVNDIRMITGKIKESEGLVEKGIAVAGATSPIITSSTVPLYTPGLSPGRGIASITPVLNPDVKAPKKGRKMQNLADYREYIDKKGQ